MSTRYLRRRNLADLGQVRLRLATPADTQALMEFFSDLADHDLLFLRHNPIDSEVIDRWTQPSQSGAFLLGISEVDDSVVGVAALERLGRERSEHVGSIWMVIGSRYRRRGLGHLLASEIFEIGLGLGLRKIVAEVASDQKAAIQVFERLGFRVEGNLIDHVRDRNGDLHDLTLMAAPVHQFMMGD